MAGSSAANGVTPSAKAPKWVALTDTAMSADLPTRSVASGGASWWIPNATWSWFDNAPRRERAALAWNGMRDQLPRIFAFIRSSTAFASSTARCT